MQAYLVSFLVLLVSFVLQTTIVPHFDTWSRAKCVMQNHHGLFGWVGGEGTFYGQCSAYYDGDVHCHNLKPVNIFWAYFFAW